jgi:hypothetical protein
VRNTGTVDMMGLHPGIRRGFEAVGIGGKNEKSFREMPKPLKSLKTAKSGVFRI